MIPAGRDFVIDHKTTSKDLGDGSPFWTRLRLDLQVSTYLVGARSLGFDPVGAVWDVVRKPSIKPLKATPLEERKYTKATAKQPSRLYANQSDVDEPLEDFRARLAADIAANPDSYYRRGFVVRSVEEERQAAFDRWGVVAQIDHCRTLQWWPRAPGACERYGSLCPYFDVCTGTTTIDDATRFRRDDRHDAAPRRLPIVSPSAMTTFQRCPREYHYSNELRMRPVKTVEALAFGTLLHSGLEAWWQTVSLDAAFAALETPNDEHRVVAEELLRGYHARWINEPLDVLAVEAEFAAPLVDPLTQMTASRVALGGRIDAIARVANGTEKTA